MNSPSERAKINSLIQQSDSSILSKLSLSLASAISRAILISAIIFLTGCATNQNTARQAIQNDQQFEQVVEGHNKSITKEERVVCTTERKAGTHFKQRVCRTQEQLRAESAQKNQELTDTHIGPTPGES